MTNTHRTFWLFLNCRIKKRLLFHLLAFKNSFLVQAKWSLEGCFFIPLLPLSILVCPVIQFSSALLLSIHFSLIHLVSTCSHHYIILLSHVQHNRDNFGYLLYCGCSFFILLFTASASYRHRSHHYSSQRKFIRYAHCLVDLIFLLTSCPYNQISPKSYIATCDISTSPCYSRFILHHESTPK
jgi:hypothetical protein